MGLKHIMVHLDTTERCAERVRIAMDLAQRFSAHVTAVFAQAASDAPSELLFNPPGANVPQSARSVLDRTAEEARTRGLEMESRIIPAANYSQLTKHLTYAARDADMAVMGQHSATASRGELPEGLVEEVIVNSGRPVLVIPYAGSFPDLGKRVLVGWNGTREAARAVNDALPLMRDARAVRLLSVNPPKEVLERYEAYNEAIRTHLRVHGIEAEVQPEPNREAKVADLLISRVADFGADLLVVGAHHDYGITQFLHGSVAHELLQQLTVPALMSH